MPSKFPQSYADLRLPDIKLAHHPASSSSVTPVVLVILNRPKAKNAFSPAMAESLIQAFNLLSADPRVKCVVLTGSDANNRVFCPGADLDIGFDTGDEPRDQHRDSGGRVALAIYGCNKPVVAALNGSAVGVGITMTLPANVRVVSSAAKIGFVFARRGLCMEAASSYFLPRLIGTSKALALTTTADVLPPSHRLMSDLFTEIVPPGEVLPTALRIADGIARDTSAVSTRVMKDLMYRGPNSPEEAHLLDSEVIFDLFKNRDCQEGVKSFMEKRPAKFEGTMEQDGPTKWPWWDSSSLLDKGKAKARL